jgi:hypothetical protein
MKKMNYFKEFSNLQVYDLYSELNKLIETNTISWSQGNQICLNTTLDKLDNYLFGCGSLTHDWDNAKKIVDQYGNESLEIPEYQTQYKEKDFSVLCSQFKNTLFEKVYNELSTYYKLGRVRIMKSKPKTCLSWHVDTSVRLHYPIKTQEGCFMVIDNEVKHLPQNTWWWTDTRLPHTAFNSSKEDRIHLVAVLL